MPAAAGALGRRALDWLVDPPPTDGPWLYGGGAGIALALLEGYLALGDERYADAAIGSTRALGDTEGFGLYFGLTGVAYAQHLIGERLDDSVAAAASRQSTAR